MKRMNLSVKNLHRDGTKCTAANGSKLKMLGFIPVRLRVKDKDGEYPEAIAVIELPKRAEEMASDIEKRTQAVNKNRVGGTDRRTY